MSGLVDRAREPPHSSLIMRRVRGRARLYIGCRLGPATQHMSRRWPTPLAGRCGRTIGSEAPHIGLVAGQGERGHVRQLERFASTGCTFRTPMIRGHAPAREAEPSPCARVSRPSRLASRGDRPPASGRRGRTCPRHPWSRWCPGSLYANMRTELAQSVARIQPETSSAVGWLAVGWLAVGWLAVGWLSFAVGWLSFAVGWLSLSSGPLW
jgi:hypothetical protein